MKTVSPGPSFVPGVCLAAFVFLAQVGSLPAADLDPVMVGQWPGYTTGPARRVAVSDNHAYVVTGTVVGGDGLTSAGLQVMDISNPTRPQRVRVYESGTFISDVAVCGQYAYVTGGWREGTVSKLGLQVLDVSDPANPRLVGKASNGNDGAQSVSVSGDYAYVTGVCWEGGGRI